MKLIGYRKYGYFQPTMDPIFGNMLLNPEREHRTRSYELVYEGFVSADALPGEALEKLWFHHNSDTNPNRPRGQEIRSMCMGDIVALEGLGVWLCDICGWTQITQLPAGVDAL